MRKAFARPILISALILGGALLSGCGTLARSEFEPPPVQIPESWQSVSVSDDVRIDAWWQQFDDPALDDLIGQVLQNNSDLAQATLTLRKARLQAGLSEQDLYPQPGANLSASLSKPLEGGDSSRSYSASLSVSYEADLWGRVGASVDQSQWTALASVEDLESTAQGLVSTTASLYWQIGYLRQRLVLADDSLAYAEKTLELAQLQYDAGAVSRLNVLQARRSLAAQRASRITLQQQLQEAQNALSILCAQPPGELSATIEQLPQGVLPEVAVGIPADLLVRRPDIKASMYRLRAALAGSDATVASYLPSLTLSGSVGDSSSALKELLSDPVATLGAGLVLPFLRWNEMQLNKQIAEVDYQSAVVDYRNTLYQAFEDVDNAISARRHYVLQAEQQQLQYAAASEAERLYENQYRNGAVPIQDWLAAQDDRRSAEESLLENRYNQLTALATLYLALGGSDTAPAVQE
ncbi:MAG: efflux transporter outer membrane subunit [Gammaproteobacteria bacterium]|nr:efflux transporter outer membrane subunit [Gammaproteobacteria bacterium]